VKNLPVPKRDYYFPLITENIDNIRALRTVEFIERLSRKVGFSAVNSRTVTQAERDEKSRRIAQKIFEDLKRLNEQHGSQLVLVYLPTIFELEGRPLAGWTAPQDWAAFLDQESHALKIPFINLFPAFQSLRQSAMSRLFIAKGELPYPEAEGHLNNAGNELVARLIHDRFVNQPSIACVLWGRFSSAFASNGNAALHPITGNPVTACPHSK